MAKRALSWKRAGAIGWRDLKSAPGKFGFVVLSVAVGVAALVGVRGFSESFRQTFKFGSQVVDGWGFERADFARADGGGKEQNCGD